MLAYIHARII